MVSVEPLQQAAVRKVVRQILEEGEVEFWRHAEEEMAKDRLSQADCINVLRGGWPDAPEFESGRWRYRIRTTKICVVIQFESDNHLAVVTVWRE